jgi:hypothetical protein
MTDQETSHVVATAILHHYLIGDLVDFHKVYGENSYESFGENLTKDDVDEILKDNADYIVFKSHNLTDIITDLLAKDYLSKLEAIKRAKTS